jgi:hypothetical protein
MALAMPHQSIHPRDGHACPHFRTANDLNFAICCHPESALFAGEDLLPLPCSENKAVELSRNIHKIFFFRNSISPPGEIARVTQNPAPLNSFYQIYRIFLHARNTANIPTQRERTISHKPSSTQSKNMEASE